MTTQDFSELLLRKVMETLKEPEYAWDGEFEPFMRGADGNPVVRVSIANAALDTDIWTGLRSPAQVGMYPLEPADIWMHHASMTLKTTLEDGSSDPLAVPESFESAKRRFRRVVLLCGMLVANPKTYETYAARIAEEETGSYDRYGRAMTDLKTIINKAIGKVGLAMLGPDRAVIPMTDMVADLIIKRTRSEYFAGRYHGPCNHHWPNNSVAVMTGLLRFGVHRLPFRDEVAPDGGVRRLFGRYRSVVLFDHDAPVSDEESGVTLLDDRSLADLRRVADFTDVSQDVVAQRFCTYNTVRSNGASVCGRCLEACPSGALPNSAPNPDGAFSDPVQRQARRMKDGSLDFDADNCLEFRTRRAQLYDDYVCGRCEAVCATRGVRKAARQFTEMAKNAHGGA